MKAFVFERYGSPEQLQLREVSTPELKPDQVLVQIYATSLNQADLHLLYGEPFPIRLAGYGLFKPRYPILGGDIAGKVVKVGSQVTRLKVGDAVFGDIASAGFGGFAEFVAVRADLLAIKPENVSFEQAAATPVAAITALQALQNSTVQAGQRILIHGASGGVGIFLLQIAKHMGLDITAVCSPRNLEQARAQGANKVIDYTREDFTTYPDRYDVVFGVNGNRHIDDYLKMLKPQGSYMMIGGGGKQLFQALVLGPLRSKKGGRSVRSLIVKNNPQDLEQLRNMLEQGIIRPVIEQSFAFEQLPSALQRLDTGHARAKLVISQSPKS